MLVCRNFDGKFIVDREGGVHVPQGDLEEEIRRFLNEPMGDL